MSSRVEVAVVGATGYTGVELLRLLLGHPSVRVTRVVGQSKAGEPIAKVLPSLAGVLGGDVVAFDADDVAAHAKVAFTALPHGASAPVVAALRARGVVVFDLSADFRLKDDAAHAQWYGARHAPELVAGAVYGQPELHREALRTSDLVAVPGCYATAAILAVAPLVRAGLVEPRGVIVDAKSGVSGAGRTPGAGTHFAETTEGIRAYKAAGAHRHTAEIEQELALVAGAPVTISLTPHLTPMTRGILAVAYGRARTGATAEKATHAARALYAGSPVVVVLDPGSYPDTLWVRGSARAHVAYTLDARADLVVAQCAIDNLGKGAAGQAVQCFNVRFGLDESAGLPVAAMFP